MDSKQKQFAGLIRKCLSNRYTLRMNGPELFDQMVSNRDALKAHFAVMGVEFRVLEDLGIAFLDTPEPEQDEVPYALGRTRTLPPLESLALLFLRQRWQDHFLGQFDRVIPRIERNEIREHLRELSVEVQDSKFEKRFDRAIKSLKDLQFIVEPEPNVFDITPVCAVVVKAEMISSLLTRAKEHIAHYEGNYSSSYRDDAGDVGETPVETSEGEITS